MLQLDSKITALEAARQVHAANVAAGWWKKGRYVGTSLMLCVSELSEAMEGHRKDLQDDHLPQYKMLYVELADTVIRVLDLMGWLLPLAPDFAKTEPYCRLLLVENVSPEEVLSEEHRSAGVPSQLLGCVANLVSVTEHVPFILLFNTKAGCDVVGYTLGVDRHVAAAMLRLGAVLEACFAICELQGVDLLPIINAKLAYNAKRADHKLENREKVGGKAY